MTTTIKMDDMPKMRCASCGEKPKFTQTTGKKGALFTGRCACKTRVFWVDKADYDKWHEQAYQWAKERSNG